MNISDKKKSDIGKTFNFLTIIEFTNNRRVKCKCACGNIKECDYYNLKSHKILGCGCQRNTPELREQARKRACQMIKEGVLNKGFDRKDEHTPFRYLFKCINNSNRKALCEVSINDLK